MGVVSAQELEEQILDIQGLDNYSTLYAVFFINILQILTKMNNVDLNYKVYWQKQGMDSLCGVHCINSLLQGPYFDEIALSHIALDLDKKEHQLMAQQGMTGDLMKYLKEESGNVAMDGNYSIQVLQCRGVEEDEFGNGVHLGIWGKLLSVTMLHIGQRLGKFTMFGMRLPEIISDFYLSAFLVSVKQCGFQIFSVEGEFPKSTEDSFDHYNDHQQWYPAKRIKKYQQKKMKRKGYKPNINGGGTDKQMQKAIAISLGKKYDAYKSSGEDSDWDNDNKKKQLKPFTGSGVSMGGSAHVCYDKFQIDADDVEMISIMKMGIQEKLKEEVMEGINVIFRFPDGKKKQHVFRKEDLISDLYDFVWVDRNPHSKFYLVDFGSKNQLVDLEIPIMAIEDPTDQTAMITVCDL